MCIFILVELFLICQSNYKDVNSCLYLHSKEHNKLAEYKTTCIVSSPISTGPFTIYLGCWAGKIVLDSGYSCNFMRNKKKMKKKKICNSCLSLRCFHGFVWMAIWMRLSNVQVINLFRCKVHIEFEIPKSHFNLFFKLFIVEFKSIYLE